MNPMMNMVGDDNNLTNSSMHHTTPMIMNHHDNNMMMSHSMVMHTGHTETIVFSGWTTHSVGGFVATCIGLFFIAFAYESIKFVRSRLLKLKYLRRMKLYKKANPDTSSSEASIDVNRDKKRGANLYFKRIFNGEHLLQTISYLIQVSIAYFLMLAFMTYNYWICLSILLGLGVGYFFFGYQRSVYEIDEDCCI